MSKETCVICPAIEGKNWDATWIREADIVYRDELCLALVNSKFIKGNEGHVIVVPAVHATNLYDIPRETLQSLVALSQKIAKIMKEAYACDGVTIVQNNEPAGDQHAMHYHMHIIPRYENDQYHFEAQRAKRSADEDRLPYAKMLKEHL